MKLAVFILGFLLPLFCIALPEKNISKEDLNNGAVALNGLWAFDWQALHTDIDAPVRDGLMLPGMWHKQGPYPAQGFATLRLKVSMPYQARYYLRIPDVPSAVSLWVNGELLFQRGVVSNQAAFEVPKFGPQVVPLPPKASYDLILHVSNFHHKDGGVWHNLMIADELHRSELQSQSQILDAMIFTFLVLSSIYLLLINLTRKGYVSHLFFSLFIWAIAIRSLMVGERIAYDFVAGISWESWQRIEHILLFLALPSFVYFFHRFFLIKNMLFAHGVFLVSIGLVVGTLLYPATIFTQFGFVAQILGLITVLYITTYSAILIKQRSPYSLWFSVSFFGAALFVIHDYLYTHLFIQSRPLTQFGMVFFVALQLHMLWLQRKNDLKLLMFVKSSIDNKTTELISKNTKNRDVHVNQWLSDIKPFLNVLNVNVNSSVEDVCLTADKDKLKNVVLMLIRVIEKNGLNATLKMVSKYGGVEFNIISEKNIQNIKIPSDEINCVHQLLNEMDSDLRVIQSANNTDFQFSICTIKEAGDKDNRNKIQYIGNDLAESILFNEDDNRSIELSLGEYFYLIKAPINRNIIIKVRPKLIVWRLDKYNEVLLEDIQSVINEFPTIPILLLVDDFHKSHLAQCIRMGVADYIISPVLPEELILKVQRIKFIVKEPSLPISSQDIRDVTVQLVRTSIAMWQKYSNKSKVDLAENSRLWRVYLDGSTAKTRTLDKYLSLQTLPKNPRWETVARTASFVLDECKLDDQDSRLLTQQLKLFNQLLAA